MGQDNGAAVALDDTVNMEAYGQNILWVFW